MKYSATFSLPSMMVASASPEMEPDPTALGKRVAAQQNPMRAKNTMSYKSTGGG